MMGVGPVPERPAKRRVLVIVDDHEMEKLEYEGGASVLLDKQSHIINVDEAPDAVLIDRLEGMDLLVPGHVLVQNPYLPDDYVQIGSATVDIAASKHHLFTEFCGLLGVKSVSIKQIEVVTESGSFSASAEAGRLGVSGKVSAEHSKLRELGKKLSIKATFSGGEPDIDGAEDFLCRHRLLGDQHMRSLLGLCRQKNNRLTQHTVTLCLTDKANTNLKIAARLKVPTMSFSADIERSTERAVEFNLTLDVRF